MPYRHLKPMRVPPRHWVAAHVIALAVGASSGRARAQTPATVNIAVDATAPGAALERVWPFHGFDEVNYTTTPDGRALLGTLTHDQRLRYLKDRGMRIYTPQTLSQPEALALVVEATLEWLVREVTGNP